MNSSEYIRGYSGDRGITSINTPQKTDVQGDITGEAFECIDKMIDLCKKEGVELIFFNAPYQIDEESFSRQNTLRDYVESKGYEMWDKHLEYLADKSLGYRLSDCNDLDISPDCNGISVLVYDEDCEYPMHAMEVNVYESTEVTDMEIGE